MKPEKLNEIRERHLTLNRNASGKLIFSEDLHIADQNRADLLTALDEVEAKLARVEALLEQAECPHKGCVKGKLLRIGYSFSFRRVPCPFCAEREQALQEQND